MSTRIIGGITVDLDDGPIRTKYGRGEYDGKQTAWLLIGEGSDEVAITVAGSPAETLAKLQDAVSELRVWAALQERLKYLPEVA